MTLSVTKQYHFSYAHHLPGHELCGNNHGHNGVLEIEVAGKLQPNGMIIDFHDLDELVTTLLADWDHHDLNEVLEVTPTIEHMVVIARNRMSLELHNKDPKLILVRMRIYETDKCWAEWKA